MIWWLPWLLFVCWAVWVSGCAHYASHLSAEERAVQQAVDILLLVPLP